MLRECCFSISLENFNIDKLETPLKLEDLYQMNETVLLIDTNNTKTIDRFCLDNYVVSLFSFGYSFTGFGNLMNSREMIEEGRLNLKPISNDLLDIKYIVPLFKKMIPEAQDRIALFYLCYQVIEILIAVIFREDMKQFITELKDTNIEMDLFTKKEQIIKKTSEKSRVKQLLSSYTKISTSSKNQIQQLCVQLLDLYNAEKPDSVAECIYAVRNLLVHRCYLLNPEGEALLQDINDLLQGIVIEMLLSFSCPLS